LPELKDPCALQPIVQNNTKVSKANRIYLIWNGKVRMVVAKPRIDEQTEEEHFHLRVPV